MVGGRQLMADRLYATAKNALERLIVAWILTQPEWYTPIKLIRHLEACGSDGFIDSEIGHAKEIEQFYSENKDDIWRVILGSLDYFRTGSVLATLERVDRESSRVAALVEHSLLAYAFREAAYQLEIKLRALVSG